MNIFQIYQFIYHFIYLYIVVIFVLSIFRKESIDDGRHPIFIRQIGYAMIIVPFLLRILHIR